MCRNQQKKILITGATGFIGRYIVEQALKNGFEVFVALRNQSDTSRIDGLNFKRLLIDFSSLSTIERSLPENVKFDTVVHNAGVKACTDKRAYYTYNTELTRDLCGALFNKQALKGRFIYISSLAALGPGDEKTLEPITETKEESPISHYGKSKLLAEKEVVKSGLPHIILRPTAVYGKGTSDYRALVKLVGKGWAVYTAGPHQKLSFVHAEDVAKIVFLTNAATKGNQIFNVSDGRDYTLKSFYETVALGMGVKTRYKVSIPLIFIKGMAQLNHYIEKILNIKNALNSTEKANEVTALNWKCSAKKLADETDFKASHALIEIVD